MREQNMSILSIIDRINKQSSDYCCLDTDFVAFLLTADRSVVKTALWLALQCDASFKDQKYVLKRGGTPYSFKLRNMRCAEATHLSPSSVTNAINTLVDEGFLVVDKTKKTAYFVKREAVEHLDVEDDEDEDDVNFSEVDKFISELQEDDGKNNSKGEDD